MLRKLPPDMDGLPSCGTCNHAQISLVDKNTAGQLLCRSRPPVPFAIPMPTREGVSVQILTLWPIVQKTDHCADFDDGLDGEEPLTNGGAHDD